MPGPYEGVHGFVFLYEGDPRPPSEVIDDLLQHIDRDHGPVFFASTFDGTSRASPTSRPTTSRAW